MDKLLLIDIVNSGGRVLLQTVWVTTPDIVAGRRRTDIEPIAEVALLLRRLRELVPLLIADVPAIAALAA